MTALRLRGFDIHKEFLGRAAQQEVLDAVRSAWPSRKPIAVRISATDWVEDGGLTGDDAVAIAAARAAMSLVAARVSGVSTLILRTPASRGAVLSLRKAVNR